MFHRHSRNYSNEHQTNLPVEEHRRGFFHHNRRNSPQQYPNGTYDPSYNYEHDRVYSSPRMGTSNTVRDVETTYSYAPPSTRSDWDHYAVRHEDALIGDPIPFSDSSLNHQVYRSRVNPYENQGQLPPYQDNYSRHPNESVHYVKGKRILSEGPVTFDAPLDYNNKMMKGNYASGSVIEDGYARYGQTSGPNNYSVTGKRERDSFESSSSAWGNAPLWGNRDRDIRDNRTPLLAENPWTHNELGREYLDGRTSGLYKPAYDAPVHSASSKMRQNTNTNPNAPYYTNVNHPYPNSVYNNNYHPQQHRNY